MQAQDTISKKWILIVLILYFSLAVIALYPYFRLPLVDNEGLFDSVGLALNQGRHLYSEIWEHKPPLAFIYYRLLHLVSADPEVRLHVGAILLHGASALALLFLTFKIFKNIGIALISGFGYGFLLMNSGMRTWTMQIELVQNIFVILSIYFSTIDSKKWSFFVSGLFWSCAFFCKPTTIFIAPVILFLIKRHGNFLNRLQSQILGINLVAFLVMLPFLVSGRLGMFWVAMTTYVLKVYSKLPVPTSWVGLLMDSKSWLWQMILDSSGALFLLVLALVIVPKEKQREVFLVAGWLLASLIASVASPFQFGYYFLVVLPPLAILISVALVYLWKKSTWFALAGVIIFLTPLCLRWSEDYRTRLGNNVLRRFMYSDWNDSPKAIGLAVAKDKKPGDKLVVWARVPQVYSYAGIAPEVVKTVLITHTYNLLGELEAVHGRFDLTPPKYVVLSTPVLPGELPPPDWLLEELKRNYKVMLSVKDNFEINLYRKIDSAL